MLFQRHVAPSLCAITFAQQGYQSFPPLLCLPEFVFEKMAESVHSGYKFASSASVGHGAALYAATSFK